MQHTSEQQVRQAYRVPEERCAHVQKFNGFPNATTKGNHPVGGVTVAKKGKSDNHQQIPRDCSVTSDVTCLNSFTIPSLPAKSNWPPMRLKRCFVGAEPPLALTKEELHQQKPSGIPNLGNTCYANSVLQCLARVGLDWSREGDNISPSSSSSSLTLKNTPRFLDLFLSSWTPSPSDQSNTDNNKSIINLEDDASRSMPREMSSSTSLAAQEQQKDLQVSNSIRSFFSKLRCVYGEKVSLADVMKSLDINVYEQQDAQEFYVLLIENIAQNLNLYGLTGLDHHSSASNKKTTNKKTASSPAASASSSLTIEPPLPHQHIGDLKSETRDAMVSVAINTLTCHHCDRKLDRGETMGLGGIPLNPSASLEHAIKRFLQAESDPQNTFHCEECDEKKAPFSTQYQFKKFPPIVCFHFLRFRYDPASGQRIKMRNPIRIPEFVDLYELCGIENPHDSNNNMMNNKKRKSPARRGRRGSVKENSGPTNNNNNNKSSNGSGSKFVYRLQSAVLHKGATAMRGHYISIVRGNDKEDSNIWWKCDDDEVKRMEQPLFTQVSAKVLANNNNKNKNSFESGMNELYGVPTSNNNANHNNKTGGRKSAIDAKQKMDQEMKKATSLLRSVRDEGTESDNDDNGEDAAVGSKKKQTNNTKNAKKNDNNNTNTNHDEKTVLQEENDEASAPAAPISYPSDKVAWTSEEVFMVWYELVERRIEDDDEDEHDEVPPVEDKKSSAAVIDVDEDDDKTSSITKKSAKERKTKKGSNNNNKKNVRTDGSTEEDTDEDDEDSSLFSTPSQYWPQLLKRSRVSRADASNLRQQYDQRLKIAEEIFDAWRKCAAYLTKTEKEVFWAMNTPAQPKKNYLYYVLPEKWIQQIHAGAVRESDFDEDDTKVDIGSPDLLFLTSVFEDDEIFCHQHNADGSPNNNNKQIVATSTKNNSNSNLTPPLIKPLAPFRLVGADFFTAFYQLYSLIHRDQTNPLRWLALPAVSDNNRVGPSPHVCNECVKQRVDDISSNRESEQRLHKMRDEARKYERESADAIARKTSLGKKQQDDEDDENDILMGEDSPKNKKNAAAAKKAKKNDNTNNDNKDNNNDDENSSSLSSTAPHFIATTVYEIFMSAKNNTETLKEKLNAQDLSQDLICPHNSLRINAATKIVSSSVYQYLHDEFKCFTSFPLPLWKLDDNEVVMCWEPCKECSAESLSKTAEAHAQKQHIMAESRHFKTVFDKPEKQTDLIINDKKLKENVRKHKQEWKESEQMRINEIIEERRQQEEKKTAFTANSRIQITSNSRGGRGARGGRGNNSSRGGRGNNNNNTHVDAATPIDVDEQSSSSSSSNGSTEVLDQDAAGKSGNKNNNTSNKKKEDDELKEREPQPRIVKFPLVPLSFVYQWKNYIKQKAEIPVAPSLSDSSNSIQQQQQQQVSVDGEEVNNTNNNSSKKQGSIDRPLLENYSLRCQHHRSLAGIDIEDLKTLAQQNDNNNKRNKSSSNNSSEAQDLLLQKYQAVTIPLETLRDMFDDTQTCIHSPYSNLTFQQYQQQFLVSFVQNDENVELDPPSCEECIKLRRDSFAAADTTFDDAWIEVEVHRVPKSRKQIEPRVTIQVQLSSDDTTETMFKSILDGLFEMYQVRPTQEELIQIKKKTHQHPIPRSLDLTVADAGIHRTGTTLKVECTQDCVFEKLKKQDLEEEELQKAIQASLDHEKQEQEMFASLSSVQDEINQNDSSNNGGNNNSKPGGKKGGGRQKGIAVQLGGGDGGRAAFQSSRLGGGGGGGNNKKNQNKSNEEIPCPTCTFLNRAGCVVCEICGGKL